MVSFFHSRTIVSANAEHHQGMTKVMNLLLSHPRACYSVGRAGVPIFSTNTFVSDEVTR